MENNTCCPDQAQATSELGLAPERPGRYDALGWLFVLGGLTVAVVLGLLSDGIYMNDDATHYFFARDGWRTLVEKDGWDRLSVMWHRWGRIGYTAPTSPVAYWLGFAGCRVFSAVQTALIALLAWRSARRLIGPGIFAAAAALMVWLQPLTFRLALTTLTETTGALYLMLAIFLYVRGNRLWSCVTFSALFLTRDEMLALAPLVALAMLLDARRLTGGSLRKALATKWVWAGCALLAAGPVLYVLISIPVDLPSDGDPLQIFSREYSAEYGTGPLYWMAARWSEQATPTIVALGLLGLGLLVRSLWRRKPLVRPAAPAAGVWLIPTWTIAYLALHSVFFSRGMFAHGGEGRYMIPLSGLLALPPDHPIAPTAGAPADSSASTARQLSQADFQARLLPRLASSMCVLTSSKKPRVYPHEVRLSPKHSESGASTRKPASAAR